MNTIKVYKLNEVYFQLDIEDGPSRELKEYLSFKLPNYWFTPKYKMGFWDGSISLFDVKNKLLPSGLFKKFTDFCKTFQHEYELKFDTNTLMNSLVIDDVYDFSEELMKNTKFDIYDYQAEAVLQCFNKKRGIVVSSTGSGKSMIIYHIIRYLLKEDKTFKILLVVPNISLVEQMYSDFQSYNWGLCNITCKKLYSDTLYTNDELANINKTHKVLISTWQSIYKKSETFFEKFNCILIDEAHQAKSLSIQNVSKKCINAEYRLGFTGTLPTENSDKYNIYSFLGTPIFNQQSKELIDRGILAQLTIANLIVKYPKKFIDNIKDISYHHEVKNIEEYEPRNKVLSFIMENIETEENILFLCRHIEHLKRIEQYLKDNYGEKHPIYIVYGLVGVKEREEIRKLTELSSGVIIVASYATFGQGINIKKLHHVVAASSYKSKIKILQGLGRGLRLHETKEQLIWWDIIDDCCYVGERGAIHKNNLYKHYEQRLQLYKDQQFRMVNGKYILE